jgi:hypothetical protein
MKDKKEKIEFVKEQLAKKENWSHDLDLMASVLFQQSGNKVI